MNDSEKKKIIESKINEIESYFTSNTYIDRLLIKEGKNAQEVLLMRELDLKYGKENEDVLNDKNIINKNMFLIGNAGSGKSMTMKNMFLTSAKEYVADQTKSVPLLVDLNDLASDSDIKKLLDRKYKNLFSEIIKSKKKGKIYLDSLDERLLRGGKKLINDIQSFCWENKNSIENIVIACRRFAWQNSWIDNENFKLEVYNVDYLNFELYSQIVSPRDALNSFLAECKNRGILDMLHYPFFGFFIAKEFVKSNQLPTSKFDCINQQIDSALNNNEESEDSHFSIQKLKFIARKLACASMFSGQNMWSQQDVVNWLCSDKISDKEVKYLLRKPLFIKLDDKFRFSHQLFQELLAAEELSVLSIKQQKQLLNAEIASDPRVATNYRGVASFLAACSKEYFKTLFEIEPFLFLLSDVTSINSEDKLALAKKIIDQMIVEKRAVFWEIPPRGEMSIDLIAQLKPENFTDLINRYLSTNNLISKMWGAACAYKWGGHKDLNDNLKKIVHDSNENIETRKYAIMAITESGEIDDIRNLYDLFDDDNDSIRGYVIRAFRENEKPDYRSYLEKFIGGAKQEHTLCVLQIEAGDFSETIQVESLSEVFKLVNELFDDFGSLKDSIASGLLKRSLELNFHKIPPELFVKIWKDDMNGRGHIPEKFRKILESSPGLVIDIIAYIFKIIGEGNRDISSITFYNNFGKFCNDSVFSHLPDYKKLSIDQDYFLKQIVQSSFYDTPTQDRLLFFQSKFSKWSEDLSLPKEPVAQKKDALRIKEDILNILSEKKNNLQKVFLLIDFFKLYNDSKDYKPYQLDDKILDILNEQGDIVKNKVLDFFEEFVNGLKYTRTKKRNEIGEIETRYTRYDLVFPFKILYKDEKEIGIEKKVEILKCYGINNSDGDEGFFSKLADEIKEENKNVWEDCLESILEEDSFILYNSLDYLKKNNDNFYLDRCAERIIKGRFLRSEDILCLIDYIAFFKEVIKYRGALQKAYLVLKGQDKPEVQGGGVR